MAERAHASPELFALCAQYLEAELEQTCTAAVTVADRGALRSSTPATLTQGEARLLPVLLIDREDRGPWLTGLALLEAEPTLSMPPQDLLVALSRCLRSAGDSLAAAIE